MVDSADRDELHFFVLTDGRLAQLRRCLQSIRQLGAAWKGSLVVEVISTVPEDDEVCRIAQDAGCLFFRCVGGVASARQEALHRARVSAHIIFVDDDEYLADDYFEVLEGHLRRSDWDLLTGSVLSVFPVGAPAWSTRYWAFGRKAPSVGPLSVCGAGNLIIRASVVAEARKISFRDKWNGVGGEDTDFTKRAVAAGLRLVGAPDLVAFEQVASERLRFRFLSRRKFRQGWIVGRLRSEASNRLPVVVSLAYLLRLAFVPAMAVWSFREDGLRYLPQVIWLHAVGTLGSAAGALDVFSVSHRSPEELVASQ